MSTLVKLWFCVCTVKFISVIRIITFLYTMQYVNRKLFMFIEIFLNVYCMLLFYLIRLELNFDLLRFKT